MSAPDLFSPTIRRLQQLLAECEQMRKRAGERNAETARMIADTEKRIAECVEQLGRELGQSVAAAKPKTSTGDPTG